MLFYLADLWRDELGVANLFTYITSRSVAAALTAMAIGLIAYPPFIRWQRAAAVGQPIRDDGPQSHMAKAGTPTMGGTVIVIALTITMLVWGDWSNEFLVCVMAATLGFALIGFADDWQKLRRESSKGLTMRGKLALQSALAILLLVYLRLETATGEHSGILVPFWKDLILPLGTVGFIALGWLCLVGASNAVNLTDGLDGLAILPAVMVSSGLAVFAYVAGNSVYSSYLDLPYIPGTAELVIFCAALAGAGLAFLWFNAAPAQVFMGDTGSLAIGAALASIAVMIRQEIVFAIMGGLFVLEAVSVILQVVSYRLFGRRLFEMAPVHHHFEKKGWPENIVVVRFWIITIILVLIGLAALKIR